MGNEIILQDSILIDSVQPAIHFLKIVAQLPEKSTLEKVYTFATVLIAIINVLLFIYVFIKNYRKDKSNIEKNRKISLLKTLVLDYNMNNLYDFFKIVKEKSIVIHANNLSIEDKAKIIDEMTDLASEFRQSFIDLFIAIDKKLYDDILEKIDLLMDGLTNTMFDEGINLSHKPKFDELIIKQIRETRTETIRILFSYSGE